MLNPDIIKWAIEEFKPDGFDFEANEFFFTLKHRWLYVSFRVDTYLYSTGNYIVYELFLQRVIEGINNTIDNYIIEQNDSAIIIHLFTKSTGESTRRVFGFKKLTIDQAKEQAIEYIYNEVHNAIS